MNAVARSIIVSVKYANLFFLLCSQYCCFSGERVASHRREDLATREGYMFSIAVYAFSKWREVKIMHTTTDAKIVQSVRSLFDFRCIHVEIIHDNRPHLVTAEFETFLKDNDVNRTLTSPYHPQSNQSAKRVVQTTEKALLKQLHEDERKGQSRTVLHTINDFLFAHRTAPRTFTGKSPDELFMQFILCKLRTRLLLFLAKCWA